MDPKGKNTAISAILGLILGIFFVWIQGEIPDEPVHRNHSGFTSPLLALELSSEPEDVYGVLGGPEDEEYLDSIDRFKSRILYDLVLIILYSIYLLQLVGFSYRHSQASFGGYFLSVLVAVLAILDLVENFQLQSILEATSAEKMEEPLLRLSIVSRFKWAFLFCIAGWLGARAWLYERGWFLKLLAIFLFTSFSFYLASWIRLNLIELGLVFLALGFFTFWVYSVLVYLVSKNT
jgi:hypothetical protein